MVGLNFGIVVDVDVVIVVVVFDVVVIIVSVEVGLVWFFWLVGCRIGEIKKATDIEKEKEKNRM